MFNWLGEGEGHLRLEKQPEQKSGVDKKFYKNKKRVPHGPINKKSKSTSNN